MSDRLTEKIRQQRDTMLADQLDQLAILAERGVPVHEMIKGLAKIIRGTHEPSPDGLRKIK